MLSDMYHIILVNYPFFLTPPLEFQSTRSNFRIYIYIPVHLTSEMKKNRRESREEGSIVSQGPLTSFQLLSPRPWPKRHFNRRRRPPPLVSKPPIKSKGESLVEFSDAVPLLLPSPPPLGPPFIVECVKLLIDDSLRYATSSSFGHAPKLFCNIISSYLRVLRVQCTFIIYSISNIERVLFLLTSDICGN